MTIGREADDLKQGGRVTRDSAALALGTICSGLFAYAFFALSTRRLGAGRAAPIAVLWTYWGACTAIVTFPVQHWIIRTLRASGEGPIALLLQRVVAAVAGIGFAAGLASWLVRGQLFHRTDAAFPVLVGLLTMVTLFGGVVRGGLAGRGRFGATAVVLAGENLARVLLAAVALTLGGGAAAVGFALVAGGLLGLAWPSSYRFERTPSDRTPSSTFAFLGGIASGSLIGQVVLVGGPAVLALVGGSSREVTALFVTLAFFRAPYLLSQGLANQATGFLTGLVTSRRFHQLRSIIGLVGAVGISGALLGGWIANAYGPLLIGLVFGGDTAPSPGIAAVIAAGSALAVANLGLSLVVIAKGDAALLTRAWLVALAVVAVMLIVVPVSAVERVSLAFLGGELAALGVLLPVTWRWSASAALSRSPR